MCEYGPVQTWYHCGPDLMMSGGLVHIEGPHAQLTSSTKKEEEQEEEQHEEE